VAQKHHREQENYHGELMDNLSERKERAKNYTLDLLRSIERDWVAQFELRIAQKGHADRTGHYHLFGLFDSIDDQIKFLKNDMCQFKHCN
jgi:hypothetical protein